MLFIQPHLTKYRIDFFNELSVLLKVRYNQKFKVICGETPRTFGVIENIPFEVDVVKVKKVSKFFYFKEVFSKLKNEKQVIVHFGDFKYFTLYQSLYLSLFKRRVLYLHGQGGYKRSGLASKILYNVILFLTNGYICYNEFCSIELKKKTLPFLHKKIHHIDNTLYLEPICQDKIDMKEKGNSVIFIGRVRERSGVENILEAAKIVSTEIPDFKIHIIGGGEHNYLHLLSEKYPEAVFYGELYSQEDIMNVCSKSKAGIYGGDAGLSVVHYMSLGLPVIIHNDLYSHMGPEPSYIIDEYNGLLFERDNIKSIAEKLLMVCKDNTLIEKLSKNSIESFIKLSHPSMAEKLIDIIEKDL